MTDLLLSLTLGLVGVVAYRISQLAQHGQLKWSELEHDFWGPSSWLRKYKNTSKAGYVPLRLTEPNWYYRLLKIEYKERWFTSTWLTIAVTDGYHALQFLSLKFLYAIIALHSPYNFWYSFFVTWIVLGTALYLTGRLLKR